MNKKKKILLILSGGTICTDVREESGKKTRYIFKDAGVLLTRCFYASDSKCADNVEIVTSENFNILSENMTINKWNKLIGYLRETGDFSDYDGIVITHGTDTLAFSSSLFSLVLKDIGKPVFLVSSNLPLTVEGTNGNDNFRAAVELISYGIKPNVYVTYKNTEDNRMYLHLGSRLLQCRPYDENFYSKDALILPDSLEKDLVSEISDKFPSLAPTKYDDIITFSREWSLSNCVLKIAPYVGLDYSIFDLSKFKAVLHETYHSGTVCENSAEYSASKTSESILYLIDGSNNPDCNYDIYISPSNLEGEIYDTVRNVLDYNDNKRGIEFVFGSTNEMIYAKLVVAYSLGCMDTNEICKFLETDISGEVIYTR